MTLSVYLSVFAILVSITSLLWTIYTDIRDKGKLKATSTLYNIDENCPYMEICAVNAGRRPIILTMLVSAAKNIGWCGTYLKHTEGGLRLAENELFKISIRAGDDHTLIRDSDGECEEATDLWFEDTLGRRYNIINAKEHLKILWKSFNKANKIKSQAIE